MKKEFTEEELVSLKLLLKDLAKVFINKEPADND